MISTSIMKMKFPVGYYKFHKDPFINYQLNRWNSLAYARKEDLELAGSKIKGFKSYVKELKNACEKARKENRLKNAAIYCRASEFLIEPDNANKIPAYEEFIQLFDQAFADEHYERHQVPYKNSYLSAMRIPSLNGKPSGTIIGCGGFDSFIEEFYGIWKFFAENGYEVIAFEGPGQGGTLRKGGLTFEHDWEKPSAATLDYFNIKKATAIGVSMGGYWVLRAAAFEKRIERVVSWSPVYDWLEMTNSFNRKLINLMLRSRGMMNFFVRLKMNIGVLRHAINNALFIQGREEPVEAVEWMMGMNKKHLNSHLIEQDVLLLTGENDAFQPPILLKKQKEALINAGSVSERIFKKSEHADQHCQMGNIGLALETILGWINEKNT